MQKSLTRLTSMNVNVPEFDDDMAVLIYNTDLRALVEPARGLNRSTIIGILVKKAAERCRAGLSPLITM